MICAPLFFPFRPPPPSLTTSFSPRAPRLRRLGLAGCDRVLLHITSPHPLLPTSPPLSLVSARGLMVLECHCCGFFFRALFSKEYFGVMPRDQSISMHLLRIHFSPVVLLLLCSCPSFRWTAPTCAAPLWSFHSRSSAMAIGTRAQTATLSSSL